jgi:hypothetical protein
LGSEKINLGATLFFGVTAFPWFKIQLEPQHKPMPPPIMAGGYFCDSRLPPFMSKSKLADLHPSA